MTKFITAFAFLFTFFVVTAPSFAAEPAFFSRLSAKQIYVKDLQSGQILYSKDAQRRMPTSSMSKVMTAYMVFDALKKGEVSMSDELSVSEKAWRKGGSKMFVEVGKKVSVEDLLKGVIVQSGNDATIVLAEGLAGAETVFARKMTAKAHEIGMDNSNFMNASGWPDPNHYSTAQDLGILAEHIITDFPEYYEFYSIQSFEYNGIKQRNRNPLLFRDDLRVDGIKTGHTEVGGYGLMASGVAPDNAERRVVVVMNGMKSEQARAQETGRVMAWALNNFENKLLVKKDGNVKDVRVVYGRQDTVAATVKEDLIVTLPYLDKDMVKIEVVSKEPMQAPVKKGDQIGELRVITPELEPMAYPLYAAADVKKSNIVSRFFESLSYKIFGAPQ